MQPDEMLAALRATHRQVEEDLRSRWDRSLGFGDAVFDRWERAERLGFGEGASIYDSAAVLGPVRVGAHSWIGPQVLLDGSGGGLTIGSWCALSAGVQIYTHDTVLRSLSLGAKEREVGAVHIGDGCHLGGLAVVAPGVIIGPQSVVGAHSFVKHDVDERTVVAGTPSRVVGRVVGDGEDICIERVSA